MLANPSKFNEGCNTHSEKKFNKIVILSSSLAVIAFNEHFTVHYGRFIQYPGVTGARDRHVYCLLIPLFCCLYAFKFRENMFQSKLSCKRSEYVIQV